jgi:hypothetical protein
MADAELIEPMAGEVAQSPRRRPALATLDYVLGMLVEIPAALPVLRLARAGDFRTVLGAILSVAVVIAVF